MTSSEFVLKLRGAVAQFVQGVQTDDGSWAVKGFVDVHRDVYTISSDTKVVSKIVELYIFPLIWKFANDNGLTLELTKEQNFYPDMTFVDDEGNLFAVDIKSSYRKTAQTINGMTLGAFTGYFRERSSTKNVTHPYGQYKAHIVLGIIYSLVEEACDERRTYTLDNFESIKSVIKDFEFFVQEKWKIAIDRPGSGNTKTIGSVSDIHKLVEGLGPFSTLGESVFDDYWMHYLTIDMARKAELNKPYYRNLPEYKRFKGMENYV